MTDDDGDDPFHEAENDPFTEVDDLDDSDSDPDPDPDPDLDHDDAPLADLAREVRERRAATESADPESESGSDDDPFESVDVGDVDDEAVWKSFVEGEDDPTTGVGLGAEVRETAEAEAEEHVVSKREFCQQCPHFSAPPDTTCTHEGTTIVEVVDADDFRVRNCPIVAERSEPRID